MERESRIETWRPGPGPPARALGILIHSIPDEEEFASLPVSEGLMAEDRVSAGALGLLVDYTAGIMAARVAGGVVTTDLELHTTNNAPSQRLVASTTVVSRSKRTLMTRTNVRADECDGPIVGVGWCRFRTLAGQEDFIPEGPKRAAAMHPAQKIAEWLGIHASTGSAEVALKRDNSPLRNVLFGGVTVALIEAAARSLPGIRNVDSLSVRFLRPVSGPSAIATAVAELHSSKDRAVARVDVHDDRGQLAVHAVAGLQPIRGNSIAESS